jgi:cytochrome P450
MFAFDPAGMTTFRALALLASHPEQAEQAREEIVSREGSPDLPYLRACVLESLRLWPTTPAVLRQTTRKTEWETGIMPAKTGILIFAPFFHRDDQRLSYANSFNPDLWMQHRSNEDWPLIPFSGGPGMCPGRNLVLLLTSNMLAALLDSRPVRLKPPNRLDANRPLPGTLDNYSLRFNLGL